MKKWGRKILVFLTALGTTFAAIFPAAGCTGGCANCFQCAGFGGAAAILMAMGAMGRKSRATTCAIPPKQGCIEGRINK
ncbi:MAG: hypothetical protein CVU71_17115 [Deltaproteobacteria bacterium HGW-Deltaproteobacteria-6]|jgi:hypothetical protein|nr:MAG: hypothetical protein CVU71_17115 [Deltaproteobacteria bacterium HGW-Deltaproteobacteria-6]